jgi:hypothetical protein
MVNAVTDPAVVKKLMEARTRRDNAKHEDQGRAASGKATAKDIHPLRVVTEVHAAATFAIYHQASSGAQADPVRNRFSRRGEAARFVDRKTLLEPRAFASAASRSWWNSPTAKPPVPARESPDLVRPKARTGFSGVRIHLSRPLRRAPLVRLILPGDSPAGVGTTAQVIPKPKNSGPEPHCDSSISQN